MATAHDVAAYILERRGPISAVKLQSYSWAWSLAEVDHALLDEPIEASASRPVVRELYDRHRGKFRLSEWPYGGPNTLDKKHVATVNAVRRFYARGMRSGSAI